MESKRPCLEIIKEPQQRGMRFRYACEGRAAGSIPAQNSSECDKKTWPSCQIKNYFGPAVMRVSLVTKGDPPKPHPHSLVGRNCENGFCTVNVDATTDMLGTFSNLGIQCVRRREVRKAVEERLSRNVNPFQVVGDMNVADVDLNVVRLCFEAFLPDQQQNYSIRLEPVVSNCIYDKKATSSSILKICRVNKLYGRCSGNEQIYLLCDKVQKEDIEIVFYDEACGWEACGTFSLFDVHRQVCIVFRTPPYHDTDLQHPVHVRFCLRRSSDRERSSSIDFFYISEKHAELLEKENQRVIRRKITEWSF